MSHIFIIIWEKFTILCASSALEISTPFDLSDMLQIFHGILLSLLCVCIPFPSISTATTTTVVTRRLRVFNFKYQKWALNYPQGVVEACCRLDVAKNRRECQTIHRFLFSVGWWCIWWHIEIYVNVFLPNYLIGARRRGKKFNVKCVWSACEGDDAKGSIMRQAMN